MRDASSPPPRPSKKSSHGPSTPSPVAMLRILLVDNLVVYREKMKGWILDVGAKADSVLEASSGNEALELLAHNDYAVDLIVCEWDDPDVNGAELVEQMRKGPATARMGFIAVAGNDPASIRDAKSAGANEVVIKPVTPVELLKAISTVQRTLRPRSDETRRRLAQSSSARPQSSRLSSAIATELRSGGTVDRFKSQAIIASGPYTNRLYWVETGSVFVRETRKEDTVEYRVLPGKFFGEASFVGEQIVSLHAVAEIESTVGRQERDQAEKTIQRLPILMHFFRTITVDRNMNNIVVEIPGDTAPGALKGTLDSLPFPDLMQILTGSRKTGTLKIESAGEAALLHFAAGVLRHAEIGSHAGHEIVYRVCTWPGGRFTFTPSKTGEGPQTIKNDAMRLLMEGLRRREISHPGS